jgi:hypothetical protein
MTESTAPYYHWSSRSDSLVAPYNACSPNLVSQLDYYRRRWGAVSLGCHNQRPVTGGSTLSSHAWGAACDPKFPDRATTVQAMAWIISMSAELGVNTIHDYIRQMMWKPTQGWVSASIGSVGGAWIHVETTPLAFGDGRPVEDKLPGTIEEEKPMTPQDQAYLDAKFAAIWQAVLSGHTDASQKQTAETWLVGTNENSWNASVKIDGLAAEVAALKAVNEQILAAIQGAEFPVSGTVHIGTT